MSVEPYTHCCIIQEGDMAGNKHSQEVEAWEIETRAECSKCGEPLCTPEQAVVHLYLELVS